MDFIEQMIIATSIAKNNPEEVTNKSFLEEVNKTNYDINKVIELANKIIKK